MREVDDFFRELDGLWTSLPAERIRLPTIGSASAALREPDAMLRCSECVLWATRTNTAVCIAQLTVAGVVTLRSCVSLRCKQRLSLAPKPAYEIGGGLRRS